ncbi:MAG: hypothetical protein R2734_10110 [Nocardioides sp.]
MVLPAGPRPGLPAALVEQTWKVLEAFASFGFCKAHAAAFALPTYQSAWLKAHWPAHFLAGVLTHDPGMYPAADPRRRPAVRIAVLGLDDVNASVKEYVVEPVETGTARPPRPVPWWWEERSGGEGRRLPASGAAGSRGGAPGRLDPAGAGRGEGDQRGRGGADRRRPSLPVPHRLLASRPRLPAGGGAAGAGRGFDSVYGIGSVEIDVRRRGRVTRRDLLLQVAELDRHARASTAPREARAGGRSPAAAAAGDHWMEQAAERNSADPLVRGQASALSDTARRGRVGAGGRPVAGHCRPAAGHLGPARPRPR